jgi:hypothetical protein
MTTDAPRWRLRAPVRTTLLVAGLASAFFLLYELEWL